MGNPRWEGFLIFLIGRSHWGRGEQGGGWSDQPQALQPAGQVRETTGPIQGCHLLRSTEGRREEGVALFSHFMFLQDLKNMKWSGRRPGSCPFSVISREDTC